MASLRARRANMILIILSVSIGAMAQNTTTYQEMALARPNARPPIITVADTAWIGSDLVNQVAKTWLENEGLGKYTVVPSTRRHSISSAPFDPDVDVSICYEGERCRGGSAEMPNGTVDGGNLGINITQKWLVPSYMNNKTIKEICESMDHQSDCESIDACAYAEGACAPGLSISGDLQFPDFTGDSITLTVMGEEEFMDPDLFKTFNNQIITPPGNYFDLKTVNEAMFSAAGLNLTCSEEVDFDAVRAKLTDFLKKKKPFILHAMIPSYISANFDNANDPLPITLFHHLDFSSLPAGVGWPSEGHAATIVYSNSFATNNPGAKSVLDAKLNMQPDDLEKLILRAAKKMNFNRDSETVIWKQSVEEAVRGYMCEDRPDIGFCPKNNYPFYERFPRKKDPFFPQKLVIAVATCTPFADCTCDPGQIDFSAPFTSTQCSISGYSIDHAKEVMNMLGYSPSDLTFTCAALGAPEGNEQAIEMVRKGLADVATGCIQSSDHTKVQVVDATSAFYESGLNLMILKPPPTEDIFKFMAPFTWQMWVLYLLFGLVFSWLGTMFEQGANRGNYPFFFLNPRGWPDVFIYGLAILVDPAVGDKGQATTAGRALKSVTSFCIIIVLTVYTGQTAAALTAVTLNIEINSVEDLYGRNVAVGDPLQQSYKYLNYYYGQKAFDEGRITNGKQQANLMSYASFEEMVAALDSGAVEAIVYDDPVLQYFSKNQ